MPTLPSGLQSKGLGQSKGLSQEKKGISVATDRAAVQFKFDSAVLAANTVPRLQQWGEALRELTGMSFRIEGHTDFYGSGDYNQDLSERRAYTVRDYLVRHYAIDPARLQVAGFGDRVPLDGNYHCGTRQQCMWNRRVEFVRVGN